MNERIKELAEQAGWMMGDEVDGFNIRLEKFYELARADEREECAKVCELIAREIDDTNGNATYCAKIIRTRRNK